MHAVGRVGQLVRGRWRRIGTHGTRERRPGRGHIILTFHVFPEDDHYVADCPDLGVSSFGPTENAALHAGLDAVGLYLVTIADLGQLGRVFDERGIKIHPGPFPDADDEAARPIELRPRETATVKVLEVPAGVGVG